ncbi:MAG: aspartate aminotransferase family protein [Myxococcota bacterium]|nr:aspartate aminotransferase family protein [Myxococcota bacterium]
MGNETNNSIAKRGESYLVQNYRPQPIALVRGQGCQLEDADGKRYLDLMGGIATAVLGHCHPALVRALDEQAHKIWHVSNLYTTAPQTELAERLVRHSFADRAFFCNSGAEANEAALKLARRWHRDRGDDRYEIIAFENGFHGRTLFTVSATGTPAYWQGFEPLVPGIHHAPFGDLAAVEALLSPKTAAILVEPVQGEAGVHPAPDGFLRGLRELADRNGCLLIFDEVQTGMGRTGTLFAHEQHDAAPDIMTLAKALGGGIPIGAMCVTEAVATSLVPGSHASTFGGNPLAAACACAVMDVLIEEGVLEHGRRMGSYLGEQLDKLAARHAGLVVEVRGMGLLRAVELRSPVGPVVDRCREEGVLVITAGEKVVRLAPPLVIEQSQLQDGLDVLERALAAEPG